MSAAALSVSSSGVRVEAAGGYAQLMPTVCVGGEWLRADASSAAADERDVPVFVFPGIGELRASVEAQHVRLELTATAACTVEGLGLIGAASLPGAAAWLSGGFHSWSQTGVLALAEDCNGDAVAEALRQRGDIEVIRDGTALSWWMTWIGSDALSLLVGATTADRFRTWVSAYRSAAERVAVQIGCGGSGERVALLPGDRLSSEAIHLDVGPSLHEMLDRYGASLPARRRTIARAAPAGWNSWYGLWDQGLDEAVVHENARLARTILEPLTPPASLPLHVVLDDGWQQAWGDWHANAKFPSGLAGVASALQSDGFRAGIWLAPFLVHEDSRIAREHPHWLVDGAEYLHGKCGRMRILDVTHPQAAQHLRDVIRRLVASGFSLLKIDFLFGGTFEGTRCEDVTPMQAYARGLSIIREAAGEDVFILAVGAPPIGTAPYADAWRVGFDIALEKIGDSPIGAAWPFVASQARSLAARWFFGHAMLLDADPVLLRTLSRSEVETGAIVAALAGGALFLSDDLPRLAEERRSWGVDASLAGLATCGQPSRPQSLYPSRLPDTLANAIMDHWSGSNGHCVPVAWTTPNGRRIAVNVGDDPVEIEDVLVPPHASRPLTR